MSLSEIQFGMELSLEHRSLRFVHVPFIVCVNNDAIDCCWSHKEMESVTCQDGIAIPIDEYVRRLQIRVHKWN